MTSRAGDRPVRFRCGCGSRDGFTLLELLVVLAILGLGGVLSLSAFGGRDEARGRVAARDLVSGLRAARAQALETNRTAEFRLDRPGPDRVDIRAGQPERPLLFFADGGSSGGRFVIDPGGFVVDIDWLSGAVRQTR